MIEIRHPSARDVRSAYDAIYRSTPIVQCDYFYKWSLGVLKPQAGKRLLDVSCGVGMLLKFAVDAGLQAYGIDISDAAVKDAGRRAPLASGRQASLLGGYSRRADVPIRPSHWRARAVLPRGGGRRLHDTVRWGAAPFHGQRSGQTLARGHADHGH